MITPRVTRRFVSTVAGPSERGYEFGSVHTENVRATVEAYLGVFAATRPGSARLVEELGTRALARIDRWAPDLAAEIEGIAAGAGLPVALVAAINARTEVLAHLGAGGQECSTVVSLGPTGTVALQNWDWYGAMADHWLMWTIPHPDGRRVTTVTEYGIVGKIGVNERGVGTLFNILHHERDGAGELGVPVHVVARWVLDTAGDVAAGVAICASAEVSASTSVTIVDPSDAVAVELWPGGFGAVEPTGGLLFRTNHFLSPAARAGDTWPRFGTDTVARYDELAARLPRVGLTESAAFAVLSGHGSGLCCHPSAGEDPTLSMTTLATVALDLTDHSVRVSPGTPCQGSFPR